MDISVIIPCYGDGQTLERAVSSVMVQEDVQMEIIVVDDGSDPAVETGSDYQGAVKLIRTEHSGVSEARNAGLHEATGEFVTFLDADDESAAEITENTHLYHDIVDLMRDKEYDIVSGDYIRLDTDTGEETTVRSGFSGSVRFEDEDTDFGAFFTPGSFCYVWNKIYRRSFLEKHDLRFALLSYAEDRDFNARCILCQPAVYFTDDIFVRYHFSRKKHGAAPHEILQSFISQSRVFAQMSQDRDYCRTYVYQAAYTCIFGLFFASAGLEMEEIRSVISEALTNDFFLEQMRVLKKYPGRAVTMKKMRRGIQLTARLLLLQAEGLVARIFAYIEHLGLDREYSPSGLMKDDEE